MNNKEKIKILFVCMGNICRSPTAEGVFNHVCQEKKVTHRFFVDSAGTHAYHIGEPPDSRAQKASFQRGIDISDLRARTVHPNDYYDFHYMIAMDHPNYQSLLADAPKDKKVNIARFLQYADSTEQEVPDPYYGGDLGFEHVLDLCTQAAHGLLETILQSKLK